MLPTRPQPSPPPRNLPPGTLLVAERARLAELAERLRLAHDLSLAFADRYAAFPTAFDGSQARALTALRALLDRYGAAAPARRPGRYPDAGVQRDYDALLARGGTGRADAIRALTDALFRVRCLLDRPPARSRAPDVHDAYRELLVATHRQLRAVQPGGRR